MLSQWLGFLGGAMFFAHLRAALRLLSIFFIVLGVFLVCLVAPEKAKHFFKNASLLVLKCLGFRLVSKRPFEPLRDPALIISNHMSYTDVILLCALFDCAFLAKIEVKQWPLVGHITHVLGGLFVHRENVFQRASVILGLKSVLARGRSICVFPEGTTTTESTPPLEFWKAGSFHSALATGAPVVCVGLHYEAHDDLAWVGEETFLPHLYEILLRPSTLVAFHWRTLPAIQAPERELVSMARMRAREAHSRCVESCLVARSFLQELEVLESAELAQESEVSA
jgi:1-acyl-sn-glycerol-3-phosphate acyltransferase